MCHKDDDEPADMSVPGRRTGVILVVFLRGNVKMQSEAFSNDTILSHVGEVPPLKEMFRSGEDKMSTTQGF